MCGGWLGLWQLHTEVLMDHINHVCHRLLPHFQVGTRLQLERFEKPFVDVFRKMPENVDIYLLKLCQVLRPNIELVFDPREDFSHHTANCSAPVRGKNSNFQPTRAQIYQLSLTSCNFHLATATNLVIIM